MNLKYIILSAAIVLLFIVFSWVSLKRLSTSLKALQISITTITLLTLIFCMSQDLFITALLALGLLAAAFYIQFKTDFIYHSTISFGAFGGLWLAIPPYIYFIANT